MAIFTVVLFGVVPASGVLSPDSSFHERRFAGTVPTEQAYPFAFLNLERNIVQQKIATKTDRNTIDTKIIPYKAAGHSIAQSMEYGEKVAA
jgi:hypothetical protein